MDYFTKQDPFNTAFPACQYIDMGDDFIHQSQFNEQTYQINHEYSDLMSYHSELLDNSHQDSIIRI